MVRIIQNLRSLIPHLEEPNRHLFGPREIFRPEAYRLTFLLCISFLVIFILNLIRFHLARYLKTVASVFSLPDNRLDEAMFSNRSPYPGELAL